MRIERYSPADAGRWDAFVMGAPEATFCHLSGWMAVIERVWGHSAESLLAVEDGEVAGVLPLYEVRSPFFSRLFSRMLVSTPNAVYGGVVARNAEARERLLDAAADRARRLDVDFLELREIASPGGEASPAFVGQDLYVSFDHPISDDDQALMRSLPRDVRRMIRQGEKQGLTAVFGREELLDEFYEIYAASVRNLGTPVFPKRLFAEFLRQFPDASDLLIIRQGSRAAGAVMSFYFRDTVMPYYGGAHKEFFRTGVNNFMYWTLMRRGGERGHTRFDFGRSKRGTGACEFKRGWGMRETPLEYKYFLVRSRQAPNLNPLNPKYRLLVETWKRLPLSLTKLIGPRIVRNFP
ncbi:MAG: FemAB family PEP-CTERM system-associated protein [Blastocatellia bacterium]|nr:FemAB family PEP-CTERM system-associated protein [Blastocatellia bacterium]